jgi:hypothetical protein
MRPAGVIATAIVAAAVEIAAGQVAPAQTPTKPTAALVTAHVVVTVGEGGAAVSNLTAADFEVWSDGVPVPQFHVSSEPEDLSVILLIDASVSAIESWDISIDSLTTFIPPIDNGLISNLSGRDRLGLGVFGRQVRFGREFGGDKASSAMCSAWTNATGSGPPRSGTLWMRRAIFSPPVPASGPSSS